MDTDSEVDIEDVEFEICSTGEARAFFNVVGLLFLVAHFDTEYAERDIEADIVHHENADTGTKVKCGFENIGLRIAQLVVVVSFEARHSTTERDIDIVEDSEAFFPAKSDVVAIKESD